MTRPLNPSATIRIRRKLLTWYDRNRRDLPWRRTTDPYGVWLSEIMLQQTQVATALPYYRRFKRRFPRLADLARADLEDVLQLWAGLGYYARARNLHRAARRIMQVHQGRFPRTLTDLKQLPGVGNYTAAAIASICFGQRAAVVDGNVKRVIARLFNMRSDVSTSRGRARVQETAAALLPPVRSGDFNQAMMELGACVCTPGTSADCPRCPLRRECRAFQAGAVARRPISGSATPVRTETHVVAAVQRDNKWLFVRRPPNGLWGGLWELPTRPTRRPRLRTATGLLARELTGRSCQCADRPFVDRVVTLSHRRIRFVGHVCRINGRPSRRQRAGPSTTAHGTRGGDAAGPAMIWKPLGATDQLALSAAMRSVVDSLALWGTMKQPPRHIGRQ